MDDLARDVMASLLESPQYYLEMMGAAYMREFDIPIEKMALVQVELEDGSTAYYFASLEDLDADTDTGMG